MPTRAYVRPGLVYMAGSEQRNNVVVVFMGSQPAGSEQNASSCSSGGLGRNSRWKRGLAYRRTEETALCSTCHGGNGILFTGGVWRTTKRRKQTSYGRNGGPVDREGCGVPQNGGNRPPMVETGVMLIGRGVAYRKTDKTDLCWSATVETGVRLIGRFVAYRKTDEMDLLRSKWGSCSSGGVWRTAK